MTAKKQTPEQLNKIGALSQLLRLKDKAVNVRLISESEEFGGESYALGLGNKQYRVYTSKQADEALHDYLIIMLDEELDTVPEHLRWYFDDDLWLNEMKQHGGAVEFLSCNFTEETLEHGGIDYYFYQIN